MEGSAVMLSVDQLPLVGAAAAPVEWREQPEERGDESER